MTAKFLVVGRNSFLASRFRALSEIMAALLRQDFHAGGHKIASFDEALESVAA